MRIFMIDGEAIRQRWHAVGSKLDERGRRLFAAGEVRAAGRGGLTAVSSITGLARSTIERGLKDLDAAGETIQLFMRLSLARMGFVRFREVRLAARAAGGAPWRCAIRRFWPI